jgi:hypothetical protein
VAQKKTAQEYLVKSKLYRFMSLLFVTLGIFIFCALYIQNVEGRLVDALKDPVTVLIFLFPFVPAAVLTMLADSAEKKYRQMVNKDTSKK